MNFSDLKKSLLLFLFISQIAFMSCSGQVIDKEDDLKKSKSYSMFDIMQDVLQENIDSLNNFSIGDKLPDILGSIDLDFGYSILFIQSDSTFSARKYIFDRVENKLALKTILKSDDPNYSLKASSSEKIRGLDCIEDLPYQEYSIKELARLRLEELK